MDIIVSIITGIFAGLILSSIITTVVLSVVIYFKFLKHIPDETKNRLIPCSMIGWVMKQQIITQFCKSPILYKISYQPNTQK